MVLRCPDRFTRDWLRSRFGRVIEECASCARGIEYRLDAEARAAAPALPAPSTQSEASDSAEPPLHAQEHLFERFVSGPGSALALEAARAVARGEAGRCNPLFLVGGTGSGKTHLCRAIHGAVGAAALYRSSEEFTSEVTDALRSGQMPRIRQRYRRQANMLILEDVQFLAGKRATQAELFHTLDHLVSHGRVVVLSADRQPSELDELDPKLRSRMASGLVARIGPPESQTRRSILRERAARGGVRVPDACLDLLAERELASVRDLIAGLNQVVARASLLRAPITPELVAEALDAVDMPGRPRTLEEIASVVTRAYGLDGDALRSRSRKRIVVQPRQVAMYLARRYTAASLADIGRAFGRDHTSVMYAIDVVERRIVERPQLRYELEALAARISASPRSMGRVPMRS